jgi:hypothetical protein
MIYLRHPDHGTKVATMEMEAIYDEGHGWVRYTPGEPISDEPAEPDNTMRRRGRPARKQVSDDDSGRTD